MVDVKSEKDSSRPDPNQKLVRVFDTQQESEAFVVQGLLASANIESETTSLDAPQDVLPGVGGTVILVREEDASAARRVIEESKALPPEFEGEEADLNAGRATGG